MISRIRADLGWEGLMVCHKACKRPAISAIEQEFRQIEPIGLPSWTGAVEMGFMSIRAAKAKLRVWG